MNDVLTAIQFLTRIPVPARPYTPQQLVRAVKFFPLVGALVGALAAGVHLLLAPHVPRAAAALCTVAFTLVITGCLHEDGLADVADSYGGWTRERRLELLRDSRIGTYGAAALVASLLARVLLLAELPLDQVALTLISAHMLSRWTTLPLSYFLSAARPAEGQGARLAKLTSRGTLLFGTAFTLVAVVLLLRSRCVAPILATLLVTCLSGLSYRGRLGGVTGDCFGATNQLAEIATYFCGVWN